jgi:hypothetical protein
MHIIGRRLIGNQDQNLVRQPNRFLRSRTNAEHSHKQVAIDNPEPPRAACGLMRSKPHRRRTEPVLAGDYVGYLWLRVENLLRWSYYWATLGIVHDRRFTELMTDKQLVLNTVHKLPDDTPLEKISEEIEFLMVVQQGLKALDEERVVSHEDVKARVASWAHRERK